MPSFFPPPGSPLKKIDNDNFVVTDMEIESPPKTSNSVVHSSTTPVVAPDTQQATSTIFASSTLLQQVAQQNISLTSAMHSIYPLVPSDTNKPSYCHNNFLYPSNMSMPHNSTVSTEYSLKTEASQTLNSKCEDKSPPVIKETTSPVDEGEPSQAKPKVVDVPLSIVARDPRLRRKNMRIVVDGVEFNAATAKSVPPIPATSVPVTECSETLKSTTKCSAPLLPDENTGLKSHGEVTSTDDDEVMEPDTPVELDAGNYSEDDETGEITEESEEITYVLKRKHKKKEVDSELLYKTPLSDLHDDVSEPSSYSRKVLKWPQRNEGARSKELRNNYEIPKKFHKYNDTCREYGNEITNFHNNHARPPGYHNSNHYQENSEYLPVLPCNYRKPTLLEDPTRRYDLYPKRRPEEYLEDRRIRPYAERRPAIDHTFRKPNIRYRESESEHYMRYQAGYRRPKARWDYAHRKDDNFVAETNSETLAAQTSNSELRRDENDLDLLKGPSSRPSLYRRRRAPIPYGLTKTSHLHDLEEDNSSYNDELYERRSYFSDENERLRVDWAHERRFQTSHNKSRPRSPPWDYGIHEKKRSWLESPWYREKPH